MRIYNYEEVSRSQQCNLQLAVTCTVTGSRAYSLRTNANAKKTNAKTATFIEQIFNLSINKVIKTTI